MVARNWIEVSDGNDMTTLAEVRRDENVRCMRDDGFPSRADAIFRFRCMVCPEPQHSPWSILKLRLLLRRFGLAYKLRLLFRGKRARGHVRYDLKASRVCLLRLSV